MRTPVELKKTFSPSPRYEWARLLTIKQHMELSLVETRYVFDIVSMVTCGPIKRRFLNGLKNSWNPLRYGLSRVPGAR